MSTGTVKFFNDEKGFGFIKDADGQEYFVHITNVEGDEIKENDTVEFEVKETDRGLSAVNVSLAE
ncbi:cold shock domain-containing protein [Candidatus Gracilibacteria bacterium]|nr:cold shock domain-containing protein [Candidatus Gracilibacteria bacterium]